MFLFIIGGTSHWCSDLDQSVSGCASVVLMQKKQSLHETIKDLSFDFMKICFSLSWLLLFQPSNLFLSTWIFWALVVLENIYTLRSLTP